MSGEHQIRKTDQAVQAFYCTCPKQNASHFSHQEPCHYSDTLYHYTLIYWNSCLTGVWILGTKRAFNGWISDLHRVRFSLCYMLKFMLNQQPIQSHFTQIKEKPPCLYPFINGKTGAGRFFENPIKIGAAAFWNPIKIGAAAFLENPLKKRWLLFWNPFKIILKQLPAHRFDSSQVKLWNGMPRHAEWNLFHSFPVNISICCQGYFQSVAMDIFILLPGIFSFRCHNIFIPLSQYFHLLPHIFILLPWWCFYSVASYHPLNLIIILKCHSPTENSGYLSHPHHLTLPHPHSHPHHHLSLHHPHLLHFPSLSYPV